MWEVGVRAARVKSKGDGQGYFGSPIVQKEDARDQTR
jgi:hypothetical protein